MIHASDSLDNCGALGYAIRDGGNHASVLYLPRPLVGQTLVGKRTMRNKAAALIITLLRVGLLD
jgi:hypothetical protein